MQTPQQSLDLRLVRFMRDRLIPLLIAERASVSLEAWPVPDEPVPFEVASTQSFAPIEPGSMWGTAWSTLWIRATGMIPEAWAGKPGDVELRVDPGFVGDGVGFQVEGMVFDAEGTIRKGIEPKNNYVRMSAAPGEAFTMYVEAAANPDVLDGESFMPTPLGRKSTAPNTPLYKLGEIELVRTNREAWELQADIETLWGLTRTLPEESSRRAAVVQGLHKAMDHFDARDPEASVSAVRESLRPLLDTRAESSAHRVIAVGHAHIDSAWLWPTRETIRKCARTFSNVLDLMEQDPDLVFACSSAQQYLWVKQHYPALYERIKARVEEGRFIPVGGMWVEADSNLPGAEALVRQFVEGAAFFREEFGTKTREVWLPDSFGYSAALPQIARSAGATSFLTQKLSWNDTNHFPFHSFLWEGIDGSRIFSHLPPVDTYNSMLTQDELRYSVDNFSQKGQATVSLVPFGFGDGGGGPTREMMAAARRSRSLEGAPQVEVDSPSTFFEEAKAELVDPPVWVGELYLESHRGVFASQARTKRGNRRSEVLLHEAELWATTAAVRAGMEYPYQKLQDAWRLVLLNQFHDILPGSSIGWVYDQVEQEYLEVAQVAEEIIEEAWQALSREVGTAAEPEQQGFANAGPFPVEGIAPFSVGRRVTSAGTVAVRAEEDGWRLENPHLSLRIDGRGLITSLYDRASGFECIPTGDVGNLLQCFADAPRRFDAWDLDIEYRNSGVDIVGVESIGVQEGADGVRLAIRRKFEKSLITQELWLGNDSPVVQIDTEVDWHERQQMLKLAFPVDVHASEAASEIQFGHLVRPTHENTSWDQARFETVAHKWIQVGDSNSGLAVINDAVYGHDVTRQARREGGTYSIIRQTLLKSPLFPDPNADQGIHRFRTVLAPGQVETAIREGYRVNYPLRTAPVGEFAPLITSESDCAVIETVKLANDGSGDVIVRLYESLGGRGCVHLRGMFPSTVVRRTDIHEVALSELDDPCAQQWEGAEADLALRPFEIVTLRFYRQSE